MSIGNLINNLDRITSTEFIDKTGSITTKKPKDFRTKEIINTAHKALSSITADQARLLGSGIEKYQKRVNQSISKKWGCFLFLRDLFAAIGSLFGAKTIQQQFAILLKAIETAKTEPAVLPLRTSLRDTPQASPVKPTERSRPAAMPAAPATADVATPPTTTTTPTVRVPAPVAVVATPPAIPAEPMTYENACALISFCLSPTFSEGNQFLANITQSNFSNTSNLLSRTSPESGGPSDYENLKIRLHNHRLTESLDNGVDFDNKLLKDPSYYPPFSEATIINLGRTLEGCLMHNPAAKTVVAITTSGHLVTSIPKNFSALFPAVTTLTIYCKMGAKIQLTSPTIIRLHIFGHCLAEAPVLDLPELKYLTLSKQAGSLKPNLDKCPKLETLNVDGQITTFL